MGPDHGGTVVAAKDIVEARELGRPSHMWSGSVDACRLTVEFMDQMGWLRVVDT
jgi:hypothetical protein